ncbi:MAG TPA: Xaa-Pro peptidase family protein [Vicinamibacterales bacterium]|nr:Xaa-Pro peptidase family protein [Vicinamibacterales bacterium]
MLSRRSFLRLSSLGAGVAWSPRLQAQRAGGAPPPGPLPPSIAALPSMKDRARPFTHQERLARVEKAKRLMAAERIDAILLNGGSSPQYFANVSLGGGERLWALLIPAKGDPFVVCPAFEEDRARELLADSPFGTNTEIRTWQEDESPFLRVVAGLKDRGITAGRLGIEESVKFVFADSLAQAAPALRLVSATPVTAGCRMIKDAHEIECLRLAGEATLKVYKAVYEALKEGMTQRDVSALIQAGYARVGFNGFASLNVGEYTASPHGSRMPQTIREGTILMVDDGCKVEGYTSDITRTFVLGKPTDKMKQVFDVVRRAQQAALSAAKPGVPNEAVDAAARHVLTDAGYGPGFTYLTHRVGHGLGMDMHEWPYLVKNNMFGWPKDPTLQPGMVFSDEPGIYLKGAFGVRLEDDLHVTESGAELLTPTSPSLEQPFGPA